MKNTMARSCVAYGTSSPSTLGLVLDSADGLEEAPRRPKGDVAG